MQLLERHTQLAELDAARRDAQFGRGSVVLVAGDAGSGKTTLVQRFVSGSARSARVLRGMCDDLLLPRPLGPFRDMFPHVGAELAAANAGDTRWISGFFDRVVDELIAPARPGIVVVEDAQWADEATLDAIRFLGRRIGQVHTMLVVTFRDDEVPADHPLRLAVGSIPAGDIRRIHLEPLSREAVAQLAGHNDIDELYELTGGNPFYVREMLAHPDPSVVPPTVQDAVLARVRRLHPATYASVEAAAVLPGRAERWVLDGCADAARLDEAVRLGVLQADGPVLRFPHELSRRVVEQNLSERRRRELNAQVLRVLSTRDVEPARLVHHAHQAGDGAALARYAPLAAERAAGVSSHREAIAHLEHAIANAEHIPDERLAELLEAYGAECEMARVQDQARDALRRAIELRAGLGDHLGVGRGLCRLSSLEWALGDGVAARRTVGRAVAVLEAQPPGAELVAAYGQAARLAMTGYQTAETLAWGEKAIALADGVGDARAAVHAQVTVGVAHMLRDPNNGGPLAAALTRALELDDVYAASRAYINLAHGHIREMRYDEAARYVTAGLAYCEARELQALADFLVAVRSWGHLELGRWSLAEQDADTASRASEVAARLMALKVTSMLQSRRGSPQAAATVGACGDLAAGLGEAPALINAGTSRAELAWLAGDPGAAARAVVGLAELAKDVGTQRYLGETAYWRYRAGLPEGVPDGVPEPYRLQLSGYWREAARAWDEVGRPYECADALSDAPDPRPRLEALEIFDRLGAVPRAAMVRSSLARMGVTSVPRGPRARTRNNPGGLTPRQTEVLVLLAQQLTYQEIAERLQVSPKTVDHHVAAVRLKLDVSSRDDAVLVGRRLGILTGDEGQAAGPT
ncbi:ATP-binding protein [Phytoactinopolyspora limicola]|uniref:ATP-binding protein n=1 Tax=Phytoactinopolyspora limicola TaxID=2715536 RepID=UPI00140D7C87|nr:LuxR family transcriptional regulator [Phytoactinopolyspora limicola]